MKKRILFFLTMIMTSAMFAGNPAPMTKIEVYYFHFTRRCMTCQNVENESKKAVETLYPDKVKKGEIIFQSINLDETTGEALGKKYNIEGQTLIVICGEKKIDLTEKGFMYANNSPEKLKEEIRKAVETLLK
jgi:GH43 family beta-xylosidase